MDKVESFKEELAFIKNPQIKLFTEKAIESLPDYFFSIPASSSSKYHANFALGEGGLIKHVKACARFAIECFKMEWYKDFTSDEKDLIITTLLLHDGLKSGVPQEAHTRFDHPLLLVEYLQSQESLENIISEEYLSFIYDGAKSHMGAWNKSKDGIEIMPRPKTKAQKLIHWCDYVCSRRMFEVNFDAKIEV